MPHGLNYTSSVGFADTFPSRGRQGVRQLSRKGKAWGRVVGRVAFPLAEQEGKVSPSGDG